MTSIKQLATIARQLDPAARTTHIHWTDCHPRVLRAATRYGDLIVKAHNDPRRYQQELHAYRHWTPALTDHAPQLVAHFDESHAIVITAFSATAIADLDEQPSRVERAAHHQAGASIQNLHNAEPASTQRNMTAWLAERGEQWLALAKGILPAATLSRTRTCLRELAGLGPLPATPCHLDLTPRNLLLTADDKLIIIDFEHARYDLPARDLVRLHNRTWPHRPDLRDAFLDGYGTLSDLDRRVIQLCTPLDTLTAAVRSIGHDLPPTGA